MSGRGSQSCVRVSERACCETNLACSLTAMSSAKSARPPRWLKQVNRVTMALLRLGQSLGDEKTMVLTVPGRKSGTPRSTPVDPMIVDGKRYVVGGYPNSDWVQNVRAAGQVTLSRGRTKEAVRMVELPADQARPLLRIWPREVPASLGLMKGAGLVTEGTPDEFEKLAGTCAVFRIDPV
jgi:deazaflavin-dependent oxidoreductase (nitroreductase family)